MRSSGVRQLCQTFGERLPFDALGEIAAKIQPLGWHIVIYFEAAGLPELFDFFTSLPTGSG